MLKIDSKKCIGCGTCESLCPEVFKMNSETAKAEVISQHAENCDLGSVIDACPADAISK